MHGLECEAIGSLDAHEFVVTSLMQFSSIILDFTSVYLHRALLKLLDICNILVVQVGMCMHSKSCEATGFGTWLPKKLKLVQQEGVVEPAWFIQRIS